MVQAIQTWVGQESLGVRNAGINPIVEENFLTSPKMHQFLVAWPTIQEKSCTSPFQLFCVGVSEQLPLPKPPKLRQLVCPCLGSGGTILTPRLRCLLRCFRVQVLQNCPSNTPVGFVRPSTQTFPTTSPWSLGFGNIYRANQARNRFNR